MAAFQPVGKASQWFVVVLLAVALLSLVVWVSWSTRSSTVVPPLAVPLTEAGEEALVEYKQALLGDLAESLGVVNSEWPPSIGDIRKLVNTWQGPGLRPLSTKGIAIAIVDHAIERDPRLAWGELGGGVGWPVVVVRDLRTGEVVCEPLREILECWRGRDSSEKGWIADFELRLQARE